MRFFSCEKNNGLSFVNRPGKYRYAFHSIECKFPTNAKMAEFIWPSSLIGDIIFIVKKSPLRLLRSPPIAGKKRQAKISLMSADM